MMMPVSCCLYQLIPCHFFFYNGRGFACNRLFPRRMRRDPVAFFAYVIKGPVCPEISVTQEMFRSEQKRLVVLSLRCQQTLFGI